jgi:hypothetical protein
MNRRDARSAPHTNAPAPPVPSVSLAIERIVIDGPALNPLQTQRLQMSIERELTRLLQTERTFPLSGAIERLPAPPLRGHERADPVRFGVDIARSLHAALGTRE